MYIQSIFFLITVKLCNIFQKIVKITQYWFFLSSTSKFSTLFDKTQNWSKEILFFFVQLVLVFHLYACPIKSFQTNPNKLFGTANLLGLLNNQ